MRILHVAICEVETFWEALSLIVDRSQMVDWLLTAGVDFTQQLHHMILMVTSCNQSLSPIEAGSVWHHVPKWRGASSRTSPRPRPRPPSL